MNVQRTLLYSLSDRSHRGEVPGSQRLSVVQRRPGLRVVATERPRGLQAAEDVLGNGHKQPGVGGKGTGQCRRRDPLQFGYGFPAPTRRSGGCGGRRLARPAPRDALSGPRSGAFVGLATGPLTAAVFSSGVRADGPSCQGGGMQDAEPPGLSVTYPHLWLLPTSSSRCCGCCAHLLFLAAEDGGKGDGVGTGCRRKPRAGSLPAAVVVPPL